MSFVGIMFVGREKAAVLALKIVAHLLVAMVFVIQVRLVLPVQAIVVNVQANVTFQTGMVIK